MRVLAQTLIVICFVFWAPPPGWAPQCMDGYRYGPFWTFVFTRRRFRPHCADSAHHKAPWSLLLLPMESELAYLGPIWRVSCFVSCYRYAYRYSSPPIVIRSRCILHAIRNLTSLSLLPWFPDSPIYIYIYIYIYMLWYLYIYQHDI